MSDETTSGAPAETTYTSDATGLREAAANVVARRGGAVDDAPLEGATEVREALTGQHDIPDDAPITARRAAKSLSAYRQGIAEQQQAVDRALGLEVGPEATAEGTQEALQQAPPDWNTPERQQAALDNADAAAARQHAEHEQAVALATAQLAQYAQQLGQAGQLAQQGFAAEFPDIQSQRDLELLAQTDPVRARRAVEYIQAYQALAGEAAKTQQVHQAVGQLSVGKWQLEQDKLFESRHPELNNPGVKRQVSEMIVDELAKSYGITTEQLSRMYHGNEPISLRSAAAQEILWDAVRYRAAKRGVSAATRKAPPVHVQKPGTRSGRMSDTETDVESARRAFRGNPTLRNAAAALVARRAARKE